MPPSLTASGGSSTMAREINSTRSGDSAICAFNSAIKTGVGRLRPLQPSSFVDQSKIRRRPDACPSRGKNLFQRREFVPAPSAARPGRARCRCRSSSGQWCAPNRAPSPSCARKPSSAEGIFDERLHRVLPAADRVDGGERLREPVAQQPRAHRRDRAVERAVKRGVARRVVVQRLQNFQMPQRRVIQRQKIAALVKRNAA